ncbi:MAG: chromate transporter [Bacteroidales bacterium]|jgi:chromate transporter|nr:chromate transporter [Bacteroidales bacterium]
MIYLQLFLTYLKIGFFGFGGGYAMLSLIQNETVVRHAWITGAEFSDILALSQMTPGPIAINSATYIGYTVAGFPGAVAATSAVCLPCLLLMILITRFVLRLKENPYLKGAIAGIRPVVIGMIAAATLLLVFPKNGGEGCFSGFWSYLIFAGCMVGLWFKRNPILLLALSAVAGILFYG